MPPAITTQSPSSRAPEVSPVDMHVHVVGTGYSGSGCRLYLRGWRHLLARVMLRQVGLPAGTLNENFDVLYAQQLLKSLRESSVRSAVILAQDHVHDDKGRALPEAGLFYVPNDHVFSLARQHPELLPAVSIHPARPDALEELKRCLKLGAVLMKCLPNCQNINCSDRRFTRFWERMAEARLPLLAHTGGEYTLPVINPAYADPELLRLPLECGVTVIAAHVATQSSPLDPDYFPSFVRMIERYPNFYGDTSALTVPMRSKRLADCLRSPLRDRLVHGSDFPVPVQPFWPWLRGVLPWQEYLRCRALRNPIERDYQIKRAMGFPQEHFTRILELLRLPGIN